MNILYFSQSNPFYYSPFCSTPYYSTAFSVFCSATFLHRYNVFQYYSLSVFLFLFPLVPSNSSYYKHVREIYII
jgi:hypothetical protein